MSDLRQYDPDAWEDEQKEADEAVQETQEKIDEHDEDDVPEDLKEERRRRREYSIEVSFERQQQAIAATLD